MRIHDFEVVYINNFMNLHIIEFINYIYLMKNRVSISRKSQAPKSNTLPKKTLTTNLKHLNPQNRQAPNKMQLNNIVSSNH